MKERGQVRWPPSDTAVTDGTHTSVATESNINSAGNPLVTKPEGFVTPLPSQRLGTRVTLPLTTLYKGLALSSNSLDIKEWPLPKGIP